MTIRIPNLVKTPASLSAGPRIDAWAKVTGQALYADDIRWPNMAYGVLVASPYPHARIVKVDLEPAQAMPGVLAALAGPGSVAPYGIMPSTQDEHALATDKVVYLGEPVAAVAATTLAAARDAAGKIVCEYEVLKPVLRPGIEKENPGMEPVHPGRLEGNLFKEVDLEFGDTAKGFLHAYTTAEDTFFYQGSAHVAMEPHAALGYWTPEGRVELITATQTPHYVQRELAVALGIESYRIRVRASVVGGGFGGKSELFPHEIAAVLLSRACGRPVKITLSREEVFYAHRGRHPVSMRVRTAWNKDGRIQAMDFRSVLDGGAYASYGLATTYYTGALQTVTYTIPAYHFHGERWYTNKPPCGPKRGHGTTQPRALVEVHLDRVARALGIDPIELRRRNLTPAYSVTINQLEVGSSGLQACLDAVESLSNWHARRSRPDPDRGLGFACSAYLSGAGLPIYWNPLPHSGVRMAVNRDGGVQVFCGLTDIGQGAETMLVVLVAKALGIKADRIRVYTADTGTTPVDLGSYSSRVSMMAGNAVLEAAQRMRQILKDSVCAHKGVAQSMVVQDGELFYVQGDEPISFTQAVLWAEEDLGPLTTFGAYTPPKALGRYKGAGVGPSPAYSFTACVADVSVDREDGRVTVHHLWVAHDLGTPLHAPSVEGQIRGGVVMGLGEVLMERQAFNPDGRHRGPHLLGYPIPTIRDVPPITIAVVGEPDPRGPMGAKEVGQGPLNPVIPAVINAISDAVGIDVNETPVTPDKVLRALNQKSRRKGL
ncbi:MAG: molybdopterin-dependent oxidoreductase [Firmicutes bacterium]|jgi:4-hydroxybenzoyl-CoA reductase alpha subunit|uniref:Aldehyde oxidase n=1 Tax=Sulfobacillus benefaciens TaxID=453960 RepID=A0A2T2X3V2_9FIRM|nr:molybdopterin-dependent oxidoreductase [Bacillota bacterium]PSR29136.1 MAG: aldehyde oxidase [Sulfobacillus benefaciens]